MSLIKLTTKGETVVAGTLDEWGNRVVSGIITEYGDTVYSGPQICDEVLTVGDTLGSFSISKLIANGVGVLDTFSRTTVINRILTEIANVSDVIQNSMSRALSDVVSIADTLISLRKRILSEVFSITDTMGSFSITKVISNSFAGFVDSITRGNVRTLSVETMNIDDVIEKGVVRRSFDEVMSVADTIVVTPIKSCIEAIGVADTLGAFSISKLISNTINTIDSRIVSLIQSPIEEVISTDDSIGKASIKVSNEVVVIDDSVIKDTIHIENESITISDDISHLISKVVTEILGIVDTVVAKIVIIRIFIETITIADTISNVRRFLYERRSRVVNKLLQSSVVNKLLRSKGKGIKNSEIVNKLLRSKVEGIKNSEVEQYED